MAIGKSGLQITLSNALRNETISCTSEFGKAVKDIKDITNNAKLGESHSSYREEGNLSNFKFTLELCNSIQTNMNNDSHAKAVVLALKSTYDTNFIQLDCSSGCGEKTECAEGSHCKQSINFPLIFNINQHENSSTTRAESNEDSDSDLELEEGAKPK